MAKRFDDRKENKRPNSKNSYRSGNTRKDKTMSKTDYVHCTSKDADNDPRWHIHSQQLAQDVASLPFNTMVGMPWVKLDPYMNNASPGIWAFKMHPTFGSVSSATDALNMAAFNEYSFIRHANSGHANYDAPDLMLYLLAMDSIFSCYSHLMRIYGVMRYYSIQNLYTPKVLLNALGVQESEATGENMNSFRAQLNMLAYKIGTRAVPTSFDLYKRHIWMYSNVYKDEDLERYQMYCYVPNAFYLFQLDDATKKGELISFYTPPARTGDGTPGEQWNPVSLADWIAYLESLVDGLYSQEDSGIMSGDIMKAYGDNLFHIPIVPEDYMIAPVYSEEVLSQFQNTNSFGPISRSTNTITQSTDVGNSNLLSNPKVKRSSFYPTLNACRERILNMHKEHPTPDDVIVATAGTASVRQFDPAKIEAPLSVVGTEYCDGWHIYTDANGAVSPARDSFVGLISPLEEADSKNFLQWLAPIEAFYRHPIIYAGTIINKAFVPARSVLLFDQENVQHLSYETLRNIHRVRVMSMLNLPSAN